MFERTMQADPYVFYKLMHVERAERAYWLSEAFGLYEALRDGPTSVAEASRRTGLQDRPVQVLLSCNACMGIVGVADGLYSIHEALRDHVLADGRARRQPEIPAPGTDKLYDTLKWSLENNRQDPKHLAPWDEHPKAAPTVTAFDPGRHGWRAVWGRALADTFDFSRYRVVADLGGACGGLLVGLTEACPHLKGINVELEYSKASSEECIRASNASDRVSFFTSDFFDGPYPDDVDVYIMSHVLHDWDDERCIKILRRCYDALPQDRPVITQEYLLNEDKTGSFLAVFQWLLVVNMTPGDQRTSAEIAHLMSQAGFRDMEARPIDTEQSIVIGWKR